MSQQQPFGDIPFFRELQRLLESSSGPINVEIARQVGTAVATQGLHEPAPPPDTQRTFVEAVNSAEGLVGGYTQLRADESMRGEVVGRGWWISTTLESWAWLLEHVAQHFTGQMAQMAQETPEANPMQQAMGQVAPLLMGMQAGQLLGQLATETLSRYYFPIPRDDEGRLFFVLPNVEKFASDYGFEVPALARWLALQEAARHLIMTGVPWVGRYYRSLLSELVDSIEIDLSDIERRLMDLQSRGLEALQEGGARQEMIPMTQTERHRSALTRVRSFVALFEGYSNHAADAVAAEVMSEAARMDEAMARSRATPSDGETMLANLLGISFDRGLETSGTTFCAAVVKLKGLPALNRVWEAPDNLPAADEIKDPFAWMERVLGD